MEKERNLSIDLARILAMFFIVAGHFLINRPGGLALIQNGENPFIYQENSLTIILMSVCITGTNLFFLISGYLGIKLRGSKLFDIVFCIYFYGLIIETVLFITRSIGIREFITNLVFLVDKYWFLEVYLLLMLISPMINLYLSSISDKNKMLVAIVGGLILSVYAFSHQCTRIGVSNGFSFIWAAYLYILGFIIRIRAGVVNIHKLRIMCFVCYILCTILYMVIAFMLVKAAKIELFWSAFIAYNNPIVFGASLCLFLLFVFNDFKAKKDMPLVRILASTTLGVYLIHCAPGLNLFSRIHITNAESSMSSIDLVFCTMIIPFIVYGVCALVETMRIMYIKPFVYKFYLNVYKNAARIIIRK